ncbi:hypothetical protein GC175_33350 [bacterium]|nr:hypothetical protein [bacterium]
MTLAIEAIANALTMSPEDLQRKSLLAYFERERRLADLDIADIQDRYRVQSPKELAAKIKEGTIHAHPAWEDLIEWEHLEQYTVQLAQWELEVEGQHV